MEEPPRPQGPERAGPNMINTMFSKLQLYQPTGLRGQTFQMAYSLVKPHFSFSLKSPFLVLTHSPLLPFNLSPSF